MEDKLNEIIQKLNDLKKDVNDVSDTVFATVMLAIVGLSGLIVAATLDIVSNLPK